MACGGPAAATAPSIGDEAFAAIVRRHSELFGSVGSARASLKLLRSYRNDNNNSIIIIVRCSLREAEHVLASIALVPAPAMVTLDMSSSARRLKRRIAAAAAKAQAAAKVNTAVGDKL